MMFDLSPMLNSIDFRFRHWFIWNILDERTDCDILRSVTFTFVYQTLSRADRLPTETQTNVDQNECGLFLIVERIDVVGCAER
jgi:hypothetical protein